jgi:hypothetical protein
MNFRRVFTGSSVICALLAVLAYNYARPVSLLCFTKWRARTAPEMWIVPKPLSSTTLAETNGRKFSYFGYEFDTPWTEVKQERKLTSMAILNFSSGASVSILDPAGSLDELQVLKQETAKHGVAVKAVFGEDATRSNYALRSKILNLTPRDLRLFSPRQEMVSNSILLIMKGIWTKRIKGGLYSVQTEWLHGFQEGSPAEDKIAVIEAWDANDRKVEVWIGSGPGAPNVSQAEINRILFSLRPVSSAPPR